ncbi:hypothetical protein ACHAXR_010818 [Thalassiosira sp. AJA248-18]
MHSARAHNWKRWSFAKDCWKLEHVLLANADPSDTLPSPTLSE